MGSTFGTAERTVFTSESVTEGHPDKVCDQISDAVLDAVLIDDPDGRVACETAATTGMIIVFGEISTSTATRNWSAVFDPQIDALFEKQSQTLNTDERKKTVQDLERRALSQYQVATILFEDLLFAKAKALRNFVFHDSLYTNRRLENAWLRQ